MLGKRNRQSAAYGMGRLTRRYIMICHETKWGYWAHGFIWDQRRARVQKLVYFLPLNLTIYPQILFLMSCSIAHSHVCYRGCHIYISGIPQLARRYTATRTKTLFIWTMTSSEGTFGHWGLWEMWWALTRRALYRLPCQSFQYHLLLKS